MYVQLGQKYESKLSKIVIFTLYSVIGVSADLAEYSVPNIRRVLAEYSAEYSVFGRTLQQNIELLIVLDGLHGSLR